MTPNLEALELIAADMDWAAAQPPEEFNLCGWASCAIGTHIRRHPECDLRLNHSSLSGQQYPVFERLEQWSAVTAYLRISNDEADRLFAASSYHFRHERTPAHVAARIREFIARYQPDRIIEVKPLERSVVHV